MNILLNSFQTTYNTAPFSQIKNEDFLPAITTLIEATKSEINTLHLILKHLASRTPLKP